MKHKTQIPHVLVPLVPPPTFIRDDGREPHDPVLFVTAFTPRQQRDQLPMEGFLRDDIFRDGREIE